MFVGASLLGFLNEPIYTHFLRHRSFLGYLCFLQVAFIPVLKPAPVMYFVALLLGLAISLRLFLCVGTVMLQPVDGSGQRDLGLTKEQFKRGLT